MDLLRWLAWQMRAVWDGDGFGYGERVLIRIVFACLALVAIYAPCVAGVLLIHLGVALAGGAP